LKRRNERAITRVVIATGISSVVTQLLIIREFLAQFQGNEFIIALILFNWLVLGGIGTILARWVIRDLWVATANRLGWLSLILAGMPAVQILAIRFLRDVFFIHGSSVGFYPTLSYSFLIMAPYCLMIGFVLPYSLFVIRAEKPDYPGARIYIIDNLGDVSGGALFSFALVFLVTPLKAVFLANLPLLLTAFLLLYRNFFRSRIAIYLGAGMTFIILMTGIFLEPASLFQPSGKLVYYKESRYGRIEVRKDQEQFTLFVGGVPLFGTQNLSMAEETIHYPLAQLPRVQNILLISAEGGMMTELEKYRPASIDYVELDPKVAEVEFRFKMIKKIPGLKVINQDGRAYLADSNKIYDAIIVNLSEPDTYQINRFFTDRFFDLARRHLARHGVLSFAMKGFENYLAEPQRQKLSSLYNTVNDYFKHVLLLPGQKIFFLCSSQPLNTDIPALLARKNIPTRYIKGYYYGNLTQERIERLNALIDPLTPKNRDDYPQLMRLMFQQWFAKFSTSPTGFIAILAVVCMVYLIRISAEEFVLFSTGFTVMGSELLVIFAFQIFFGYIYFQIGLIVTVFLAGLLPGAWFGHRFRYRSKQTLAFADGLLILLMGMLIVALRQGSYGLPVSFFLFYGFVVSLICGFQFPVALYLRGGDAPAVTQTFSADLIGAAFGTLMTSVVLIPYFGIIRTVAGLIGLKLLSIMIIFGRYEKN
jgi:spermidine synthase